MGVFRIGFQQGPEQVVQVMPQAWVGQLVADSLAMVLPIWVEQALRLRLPPETGEAISRLVAEFHGRVDSERASPPCSAPSEIWWTVGHRPDRPAWYAAPVTACSHLPRRSAGPPMIDLPSQST